ncbi:MAG: hypothetical protein A3H96_03895 [Acidobacteria bacterium RIFCSPLOWO2_02_FULL_67_36]|nr:MAG: hypothetical protein A3H96_03895 [Acidobacteria bacterium RIFCSPLOWO2_02_FULL_67_36]OFW20033.1 MAG: hypothetical protein A3G21_07140 [Acidobacteria bacterium RIFCSPLOWO2_12_FULL_66_21]
MEDRGRLDDVVEVHAAAFPRFFMTQLGPRFLREYYRCVIQYPRGILLTEDSGQGCDGFVSGFLDPAAFYRDLRNRRVRLALAALGGVIVRPSRLLILRANYGRVAGSAVQAGEPRTAELSSIAVRPSVAGSGVGSRLVHRFIAAARAQGAERVVLTTDAADNAAVNHFYQRLGFTCVRTFEARPGRMLNEYAIVTSRFERCETPS